MWLRADNTPGPREKTALNVSWVVRTNRCLSDNVSVLTVFCCDNAESPEEQAVLCDLEGVRQERGEGGATLDCLAAVAKQST